MWRKKMGYDTGFEDSGCDNQVDEGCGNKEFGFDDVTNYVKKNPGKKDFCCDYCGIYTASRPRCNKCEEW
jgi:hypothetical protein